MPSFTRSTPILDFGPRAHGRFQANQWLLWPAWSYRVVAPDVAARELDVFQRLVLDLCSTGSKTAVGISQLVPLAPDLVALIMMELQSRHLLDAAGSPTSAGEAALEGEDAAGSLESIRTGYVFQDPWSQDLWPRFVDKLMYAEVNWDKENPRLVVGGRARRRPVPARMVFPADGALPTRPRAESIMEAVRRHRRSARTAFEDPEDADSLALLPTPRDLRQVSYVTERPEPVFLSTYAYFAEDDGLDWHACDPFGLGVSIPMRRAIEGRIAADPAMAHAFDRFIGKTGMYGNVEEYQQYLSDLQRGCEAAIRAKLTSDVASHPASEILASVELLVQQAELLGRQCPQSYAVSARTHIRTCLEKTLAHLATQHSLANVWTRVYAKAGAKGREWRAADGRTCREIYAAAARSIGLDPLPDQLLSVPARHLRNFSYADASYRLNPTLVATILAAGDQPDHPLRSMASTNSEVITRIARLASSGGAAVHEFEAHVDELRQDAEFLYETVGLLCGLPYRRS